MHLECILNYKKAADNIRKKTQAEYLEDLKKLITDTIRNNPRT